MGFLWRVLAEESPSRSPLPVSPAHAPRLAIVDDLLCEIVLDSVDAQSERRQKRYGLAKAA